MNYTEWLSLGLIGATAGCFAVTDVDRFQRDATATGDGSEPDDPNAPSSLRLTLRGLGVHRAQLIEFRLVDAQNFIQARGLVAPLADGLEDGSTFTLRNAIPTLNRPYRLDLYADVNGSGSYSGTPGMIGDDHAWRVDPLDDFPADSFPHEANMVQVVFQHNTQFTDIDEWPAGTHAPARNTGGDVILSFSADKMSEYAGRLLQVRVVQNHEPFHTVGLYRCAEIPEEDFVARIPGVAEIGDDYDIDIYIDDNGNGAYDNPADATQTSRDRGWRYSREATLGGEGGQGGAAADVVAIDLDFDPGDPGAPATVDVGEP